MDISGHLSEIPILQLNLEAGVVEGIDQQTFLSEFAGSLSIELPETTIQASDEDSNKANRAVVKIFVSDRPPGTHQPAGPTPVEDVWTCMIGIVAADGSGEQLQIVALIPKTKDLASTLAGIVAKALRAQTAT